MNRTFPRKGLDPRSPEVSLLNTSEAQACNCYLLMAGLSSIPELCDFIVHILCTYRMYCEYIHPSSLSLMPCLLSTYHSASHLFPSLLSFLILGSDFIQVAIMMCLHDSIDRVISRRQCHMGLVLQFLQSFWAVFHAVLCVSE